MINTKDYRLVVIDHDGHVKCGSTTVRGLPICYKWRSPVACRGCPMQELMKRSKANRGAFIFETTEELFEDED